MPVRRPNLSASRQRADVLIIAPREFSGTAQDLAEFRRAGHDAAAVVWLDDIYKSFSSGRVDPYAIGRFMDHVRTRWIQVPSAVALIGKGSLDRKDCMGYGDNFLPVLMTSTPWALAASDNRLLGIEDGVAPVAVGRIAITNDSEGRAYVNKLRAHASRYDAQAEERALVVADNPDSGGDFPEDADRLAMRLQNLGVWSVEKLVHPADPVRATLIQSEAWETGLVTFSGHGSVAQIGTSSENFLKADDASALRNSAYPVFLALTCAAGDDSLPGTRSLMSALVLNPDGGAIAALGTAGLSVDSDAHVLARAYIEHLYRGHIAVGEALVGAKQDTAGRIAGVHGAALFDHRRSRRVPLVGMQRTERGPAMGDKPDRMRPATLKMLKKRDQNMIESNITETNPTQIQSSGNPGDSSAGEARRRYAPPRLLSSEPLELSAATCDPPTGALRKEICSSIHM